ncbi:4-(cytidine 5'-diphospho)-2-C-methyl-D-erythritol kinase [Ramlibacter sp.]|uniref:4-(cytidine 5'-diphospho)-2-C-methyl-D-erythritol kinase n=1 Tax=Ramlibacter sp. TaxID=1917967 RepID=UPI002CD67EBB|nr:4-(cytidine 5'-diphospho)-2-C-methyl-D-erythritol kinase [Ramlibacter sp.]HWI83860.1 4-(cytidine 5'-diphospho)-2-C-methyl-D-erythritol kinase [Ramlibacter sp.]
MKALYDVPAPAKLNLFLHVIGRRADGMHLLQSAFMLIDWCDTLHFERRAGGGISRDDLGPALPADDLTVKAARALQQATGADHGVHIALDKRVPSEAGMGGGSSDAASCLLALNRLWGLDLPLSSLARIGLALGADVPFFLHGHNALVEGIGEQISPVELPPARFAVVKPATGLATARIFADPALKRDTDAAIISGFAANPYGTTDPYRFGRNDLQPVAERLCAGVAQALQWLGSQGLQGRMTGSGSAVFAPLPAGQAMLAAPAGWQARECSNMDVHPLAGWAPSDD